MGAFTISKPDFGNIKTLSLAMTGNHFLLTVNDEVRYDGSDADAALRAFRYYGPKTRFGVVSRKTLSDP